MKNKIVLKENGFFFNIFGTMLFLWSMISTYHAARSIGFTFESMLANIAIQIIFVLILPLLLITAWFMNFVNENDIRTFKMAILMVQMTFIFPVIHFINVFVDLLKIENVQIAIYIAETMIAVLILKKIYYKMKALEKQEITVLRKK